MRRSVGFSTLADEEREPGGVVGGVVGEATQRHLVAEVAAESLLVERLTDLWREL